MNQYDVKAYKKIEYIRATKRRKSVNLKPHKSKVNNPSSSKNLTNSSSLVDIIIARAVIKIEKTIDKTDIPIPYMSRANEFGIVDGIRKSKIIPIKNDSPKSHPNIILNL